MNSAIDRAIENLHTLIKSATLPDEIRVGPYKIVGGRTLAYVCRTTGGFTWYLNTESHEWDIGCSRGYFNSMFEAVQALLNKLATEPPAPKDQPIYWPHHSLYDTGNGWTISRNLGDCQGTKYFHAIGRQWENNSLGGTFESREVAIAAFLQFATAAQPAPAPTYVDHYEALTNDPHRGFGRYALRETGWQRKNKIQIIKIYRNMTGGGLAFCKNGADNNSFAFASQEVAQAFAKAVYMGGYIEYPDIDAIQKNNDIPF